MSNTQFCNGFLIGFMVAGVFGFILQQIQLARFKAGKAAKKEMVAVTTQSPEEVTRASRKAQWDLVIWTFVLILLGIGAVFLLLRLF